MHKAKRGFTLLEILLVVAAIAILAGIVIVAINPAQQLAETRDAQRRSDVEAISSAVVQYTIKEGGYPDTLPTLGSDSCPTSQGNEEYKICREGESCDGFSLDVLVPDYIAAIPVDPSEDDDDYTGYAGYKTGNDRVLVCALLSEEADGYITVTR